MLRTLVLFLALLSSPAWAIYKCAVDGKTTFQDGPCADARTQTKITPMVAPPPPADAPQRPSIAEQNRVYENERLARDIQARQNRLANFRAHCSNEVQAIAANRFRYNDNLTGAMLGQGDAAAAQARATDCNTQAQGMQSEIDDLRRLCAERGCHPL
jgi:Domain of unknown function (DUF4124)